MTEAGIREMAHRFMENMRIDNVDVQHSRETANVTVVESFISREGDPDFIPQSWVCGVHVRDSEIWKQIKAGELNGFSMDAVGKGTEVVVEIEVPERVTGKTSITQGHSHNFTVLFDENGVFGGGETSEESGHTHLITKGTATDEVDGHSHRFSVVEDIN